MRQIVGNYLGVKKRGSRRGGRGRGSENGVTESAKGGGLRGLDGGGLKEC